MSLINRAKTGPWLPLTIGLSTTLSGVAAAQSEEVPATAAAESTPATAAESVPATAAAESRPPQAAEITDRKLVGSRSAQHEAPKTMVPVTVLTADDLAGLQSSGLIAPATLRGLGPDRVVVLVNGKRRHQMARVVVDERVGKGSSGTDLNAIPLAAIERVEILRDSAAAQYGPNAVAGVINIVLKERTGAEFELGAGNFYQHDGNAIFGLDRAAASVNAGFSLGDRGFFNLTLDVRDRGETNRAGVAHVDSSVDGRAFGGHWWQDGPNCLELRDELTPEVPVPCNKVRRLRVGNEEGQDYRLFYNTRYGLSDSVSLYSFGGVSHRDGTTGAGLFLGRGNARVPAELYPDGFLPELTTTIVDMSAVLGAQFALSRLWSLDVSAGWGQNSFDYFVANSANVSWYYEPNPDTGEIYGVTPTKANAGKLTNSELTANVDLTGEIDLLEGLHLGAGSEVRIDTYRIGKGDLVSYAYARDNEVPEDVGFFNTSATPIPLEVVGGIQGFPGFGPEQVVDKSRAAWAIYLDAEQQLTDRWLLGAAARFESVQFTGESIVGKLATRLDVTDYLTFRGSASNGSRSPGVQQIYFNQKFTAILPAGLREVVTAGDANPLRGDFGMAQLKPETSLTASGGVVFTPDLGEASALAMTADAFQINIKDRIVLSESVTGEVPTVPPGLVDTPEREEFRERLEARQLGAAQFFTNAVDTVTRGIDVSGTYRQDFGPYGLGLGAVLNYAETRIRDIDPESALVTGADLFGPIQQTRLQKGEPRYNATLAHVSSYEQFALRFAFNYYGEVAGKAYAALEDEKVWSGKWLTDASVSYALLEELVITVGGNNIFDVYPDKWGETGRLHPEVGYTYGLETLPFGLNGGYYYASARYTL